MVGRIALAVASLAVAAAMAVELRAERDYQATDDFVLEDAGTPFAAAAADEVEETRDRLERAQSVRPGTTAMLLHVALEIRARDEAAAYALARRATGREPENAAAWKALATVSPDEAERRLAQDRVQALDPLGAGR
ncbi:MAG TPA: hypothetical protein VD790_02685 [Thermoleophilaceae bacterium]|nr:hypothetical protein [Thermoleophilaceae bacterium]